MSIRQAHKAMKKVPFSCQNVSMICLSTKAFARNHVKLMANCVVYPKSFRIIGHFICLWCMNFSALAASGNWIDTKHTHSNVKRMSEIRTDSLFLTFILSTSRMHARTHAKACVYHHHLLCDWIVMKTWIRLIVCQNLNIGASHQFIIKVGVCVSFFAVLIVSK